MMVVRLHKQKMPLLMLATRACQPAPDHKAGHIIKQSMCLLVRCSQGLLSLLG